MDGEIIKTNKDAVVQQITSSQLKPGSSLFT